MFMFVHSFVDCDEFVFVIKWTKKTGILMRFKLLFIWKTFLVGPCEWGFWLLKGPRKRLLQKASRSAGWLSSGRGQRSEGKLKLAKISTEGVYPGNNRALTWWSCESLLLPLLNARSSYNSAEFVVIGEYLLRRIYEHDDQLTRNMVIFNPLG